MQQRRHTVSIMGEKETVRGGGRGVCFLIIEAAPFASSGDM